MIQLFLYSCHACSILANLYLLIKLVAICQIPCPIHFTLFSVHHAVEQRTVNKQGYVFLLFESCLR